MTLRKTMRALATGAGLALAGHVQAAGVSYTGGTYSQNFDTLPTSPVNASLGTTANAQGWIDDTVLPAAGQYSIEGWYLYHPTEQAEGGVNGHQRLRVSGLPTTAATGSFYSYGVNSPSSTERALGMVPSATLAPSNGEVYYGVRLTNNTGQTLTDFTINYTGEQWREAADVSGRPAGNQAMTLGYRLGGSDIQSGTFTEIPGGRFDSIHDGTSAGTHLDGNAAANKLTNLGGTVSGLEWAPGQDLWLRFVRVNTFSAEGEIADHGLAVDDLTFSARAVPEPASAAAIALAIGLLATRRRR